MDRSSLEEQVQEQFNEVISRFKSKQFFQSDWDIASFVLFFIFIGLILLLFILVLIRCFCCSCCDNDKPRHKKVGMENMALEP